MASILNADNGSVSGSAGLKSSADSSGVLALQTNGATAISIDASQNVNFAGTAQRITGDFSNATVDNRVSFQTSTVNGATHINVLPNGTGTTAGLIFRNSSSTVDGGQFLVRILSTEAQLSSTIYGAGTAVPMAFYTGGSESLRLSATTKAVILAGGSTSANGTGITFPATQSASSDANTLDDYEEGTWTPTFNGFGGTGFTGTGQYTKIGRLVMLNAQLSGTNLSSTLGTSYISGLPFTGAQANGGGASWSSSNTGVTFANLLITTTAIYAPTQAATGSTLSFNATYYV